MQTPSVPFKLNGFWSFLPVFGCFLGVHFVLGFSGYYGQDSHAYLAYAQRIAAFALGGELPGAFFWPVNYPLAGALIGALIPGFALALPLVSLLSSLALLALFQRSLVKHFAAEAWQASAYTLMTLGCSPVILRAAQLGMSDLLALALSFASWQAAQHNLDKPSLTAVLSAAACAGLATGTRLASAVMLIVPGFLLLRALWRSKQMVPLCLGGLVFLGGLLPSVWLTGGLEILTRHAEAHHFSLWHLFMADFPNHPDGHLRYAQINLVYAASPFFRPDYCLLIPLLLLLTGPGDFQAKVSRSAWLTAAIYLVFIAGLQMQNPRFLLPALPFLLLPLFPSWLRVMEALNKPLLRWSFVLLWLLAMLFMFSKLMKPMLERDRLEVTIATELKKQPPWPLYSFGIDVAMPTHGVSQPLVSLWQAPIEQFQEPSLVLFNEARFSRQWADKNPMQNWQRLKTTHSLKELKDFGGGWVLYQIGEPRSE